MVIKSQAKLTVKGTAVGSRTEAAVHNQAHVAVPLLHRAKPRCASRRFAMRCECLRAFHTDVAQIQAAHYSHGPETYTTV